MKKKEWREKSLKELSELLKQCTERMIELRFGTSTSRPKNVREMRALRKNRARALTRLKKTK